MYSIHEAMPRKSRSLLLLFLVSSLVLPIASLNHYSHQPASDFPLGLGESIYQTPPSAQPAYAYPYDEQVGVTFTQDFHSLAFNVTAIAYTDLQWDPSGVGPAYLVNGLTNLGYWYQVGLSYNWPHQYGEVNPGFNMSYEVFRSTGVSIDPSNGGGDSRTSLGRCTLET